MRRFCFCLLLAPALPGFAACSSSDIGVGNGPGGSGSSGGGELPDGGPSPGLPDGSEEDAVVSDDGSTPPHDDSAVDPADGGKTDGGKTDGPPVDPPNDGGTDAGGGNVCPAPASTYTYKVTATTCDELATQYAGAAAKAQACSCGADCSVSVQDKLSCGCSVYVNPGMDSYNILTALRAAWNERVKAGTCKVPSCPLINRCNLVVTTQTGAPVPITPIGGLAECVSGTCRAGGGASL